MKKLSVTEAKFAVGQKRNARQQEVEKAHASRLSRNRRTELGDSWGGRMDQGKVFKIGGNFAFPLKAERREPETEINYVIERKNSRDGSSQEPRGNTIKSQCGVVV